MKVAAIIPAWNEAETLGGVVRAASAAASVDEVVVVDNRSTDGTGGIAAAWGARVLFEPVQGKGEAMRRGIASVGADIVVFLDADLYGLEPHHIDTLVGRVLSGQADMACGLCDRGSLLNTLQVHLPILSGQRALRARLFEELRPDEASGYRVEAALNSLVAQRKLRRHVEILVGVRHRTKEEKASSPWLGSLQKVRMLISAWWTYVSFGFRHRVLDIVAAWSQR